MSTVKSLASFLTLFTFTFVGLSGASAAPGGMLEGKMLGLLSLGSTAQSSNLLVEDPEPIFVSGNPSCATLNADNDGFPSIESDFGFKLNGWPANGTYTFTNTDGSLTGGAPPDPLNSVTITQVMLPLGQAINWTSTLGISAVIVKGGPNANAYVYDPAAFLGNGNHAPINPNNGNYFGFSHVEFCLTNIVPELPPLEVEKTAAASYDRTVTWDIEKTVAPDSHTGEAGENAGTSTWEVVATKTDVSDNFEVSGTIAITNQNTITVTVDVSDVLDDGTAAAVDCDPNTMGDQNTQVIVPARVDMATPGVLVCTYTAAPEDASATLNTATVASFTTGVGGDDGTADVNFVENLIGDDTVTVDDDRDTEGQFPAVISSSATFDYDETFPCSSNAADYTNGVDEDNYPNTATLVGDNTNLSDDADVDVTCTLDALDVAKTAAGTFERTITWLLDKSVTPTSHQGVPGDSFNSDWTVEATKNTVNGNYSVTGTISITNSAAISQSFTVSDVLNDMTVASVDCDAGTAGNQAFGTAAAAAAVVCTYSASPAGATATLNTATVVAAGNPNQTANAAVAFTANVSGDEQTLLEDDEGPLNELLSGSDSFTYPGTFVCPTDLALYINDTFTQTITNVATLKGPNTNLTDSASVVLTCTLRFADETATPFGPQWPGTTNWFMYTPCLETKIDLIAGQHYDAGDIFIADCDGTGNTTITVTLHSGFRWGDVNANLKIHPMGTAPTKYVQPGKFAFKFNVDPTGQTATVTVPKASYYGIHADVRRIIL